MKTKITFEPLRNLAAKPVRIIHREARAIVRPAVHLRRLIWKGIRIHPHSGRSVREMLHRIATAPFHFAVPGLRTGKT